MEPSPCNLSAPLLRANLELCWVTAANLMEVLESPNLPAREKRAAFRRWADITRDADVLAFALELLRRRQPEREELGPSWIFHGESNGAGDGENSVVAQVGVPQE